MGRVIRQLICCPLARSRRAPRDQRGARHAFVQRGCCLALLLALLGAAPSATAQQQPASSELVLGTSTEGRPVSAVRIGQGPRELWLVGSTHGAPEANTYQLLLGLVKHFRANPQEVPPEVSLYLVPSVNPDGLAIGTRFNARSVDLNRNMNTNYDACPENDWQHTVQGAYGIVSDTGGPEPESEVESQLVRESLLSASAAIFYHSNAGLVFPAFCEHQPSIKLAQRYAQAAGYQYSRFWESYHITGGMHDWAASLGIAAITPELLSGDLSELEQNIAGVQAVLASTEQLLPLPQPVEVDGLLVDALIWRYWRSHGGAETFGPPISPAIVFDDHTEQYFEQALLELWPARMRSFEGFVVSEGGRERWSRQLLNAPQSPYQPR